MVPFTIYPMGAYSKICGVQDGKEKRELKYNLYMPGNDTNFNEGLIDLAEDLRIVGQYL